MNFCATALIVLVLVIAGIVWYAFQSAKEEVAASQAKRRVVQEHLSLKSLRANGGAIDVVGESNYDWALEMISEADDRGARKRSHTAWLLSEPDNQYDSNAVQVIIGEDVVGYLSKARAAKYQPLVDRAIAAGFKITCSAEVSGGWIDDMGERKNFGVTLSLASPSALQKLLDERLQ